MVKRLQLQINFFLNSYGFRVDEINIENFTGIKCESFCCRVKSQNNYQAVIAIFSFFFFLFSSFHLAKAQTTQIVNTSDAVSIHASKEKNKLKSAEQKKDKKEIGFKKSAKKPSVKGVAISTQKTIEATKEKTGSGVTKSTTSFSGSAQKPTVDFSQMPGDVQLQMSKNKSSGKNLMEGVAKTFSVKIIDCTDAITTEKTLSFLNKEKGVIAFEFVSLGFVNIKTEYDYDSVVLKEIMKNAGVKFIFIDKQYCLKQNNN